LPSALREVEKAVEDNKALARVWLERVMNERDIDAIDRHYAPDYVYRGPAGHEMRGLDEAKRVARMLIEAVPDRVAVVHDQVAEGDRVVTRWSSNGTNTGPFLGRPPTGEEMTVEGIVITRIEGGLIKEDWEILSVQR
jgi:steroid delta-isomerase-like uncharacterized protein